MRRRHGDANRGPVWDDGRVRAMHSTEMVGRDDELSRLLGAVESAREGHVSLALVVGEAVRRGELEADYPRPRCPRVRRSKLMEWMRRRSNIEDGGENISDRRRAS